MTLKHLSKSEAKKNKLAKAHTNGKRSVLSLALEKLEKGEALEIPVKGWNRPHPSKFVHALFKDRKFQVRTLQDRSAWQVTRIS